MKKAKKKWIVIIVAIVIATLVLVFHYIRKTGNVAVVKYFSPYEKISFVYPKNWKATSAQVPITVGGLNTDSLILTSPSGKVTVSWQGAISGLGGGCDPDTKIEPNNSGCGLLDVVEKEKLPNANLYFVEWIYTSDGMNYTPRFAIQDENGFLKSTRTYLYTNVFTFQGQNNYSYLKTGEKEGPFDAVLTGGAIFQKSEDTYFPMTSKEEAIRFFSDPEMIQAKQILLSASY